MVEETTDNLELVVGEELIVYSGFMFSQYFYVVSYRRLLSYSLVRKVLADQEVPGENIGSNKCTGTSVYRKPEVQILVPVHELSPDFC